MKKTKVFFKVFFIICFVSFLTFYISLQSGYYEYNARRKVTFTKEQIERFENDVKNGNNIDINEYLVNTDKNYQNKISRFTLGISNNISKFMRRGVDTVFSKIGNAIENS